MSASHPVREWRNKSGAFAEREGDTVSQEALASLAGVVPSHLSQIETGSRRPSLTLAAKLSEVTGIPISEIAAFRRHERLSRPQSERPVSMPVLP